ncbi:MAG: septal ring lytic transglycosylase RlpA family protein [Prochlorococcaceae cyanobacterium]
MKRPLSLGALTVLLSGSSALIPVFADPSQAANESVPAPLAKSGEVRLATSTAVPADAVVIREQEPAAEPSQVQPIQPPVPIAPKPVPQPRVVRVNSGEASWYGPGFFGNRTANGEVFRPGTMTAAHRTLPFGTMVKVTNLRNGRSATVRINDRGPFHGGRIIDLAHGAAQQLGVVASGVAQVKLEILQ